MTPEQIEQSKILAEFMGVGKTIEGAEMYWKPDTGDYWIFASELKYHTSYDWLMPVWVKFRSMQYPLHLDNKMIQHIEQIGEIILYKSIEEAFTALANALKWYNEIKHD